VATAASIVLSKMRTDKNAVVSRKSAIALNGLAQILGEDAVFVGKSVPTQPYEFSEPDVDKRGPADENLGSNFTPRSMPGSMVGSVSFRMKDEDMDDAKAGSKSAAKAAYDEAEEDKKAKAADVSAADARLSKMEAAIAKLADVVTKAIEGPAEQVEKSEKAEPVRKAASRQIAGDDVIGVRKSGYQPRFEAGFGDVVFGK
jgi:hypothetical protein